jgi:flagellar protein FliS
MNAYAAQANQNYQRAQVETASSEKLLLMLYDGAIRKLSQARAHLENDRVSEFHTQVVKVQKIVSELLGALDYEVGGGMATNLARIYEYMIHQLTLALLRKDPDLTDEVQNLLEELREGWRGAIEKESQKAAEAEPSRNATAPARFETARLGAGSFEPAMASLNIAG